MSPISIAEYPYPLDILRKIVGDFSTMQQVPLVNVGYLFNELIPDDAEGHVPEPRVVHEFRVGWMEDTTVERNEERTQHPLSKPLLRLHGAIWRVMAGRTPFLPVATDKARAFLRGYGPTASGQSDHFDHGLRVWEPKLHEVILAHAKMRSPAYAELEGAEKYMAEIGELAPQTIAAGRKVDLANNPGDGALSYVQQVVRQQTAKKPPEKGKE